MFNRSQNNADCVTREEALAVADQITALSNRVGELEALARQIRPGYGRGPVSDVLTFDRSGIPAAAQGESAPTGRVATAQAESPAARTASAVDYGAIAFGLSEIKRKIAQVVSDPALADEYVGAVQYFADVFAKSDPFFDAAVAAEFKRQAGV